MITEIIVKGKPIAKKRPRFARRGKFVTTYNDQETEEGKFLLEAKSQVKIMFDSSEAITIHCRFAMPRPKNHFGTGKNAETLKKNVPYLHTKKPDLDNLIKFVLDCLNGVAWKDDSQIWSIEAYKYYAMKPQTYIEIEGKAVENGRS
jgi:Holliday junction resolvase RusA-like endonuclease